MMIQLQQIMSRLCTWSVPLAYSMVRLAYLKGHNYFMSASTEDLSHIDCPRTLQDRPLGLHSPSRTTPSGAIAGTSCLTGEVPSRLYLSPICRKALGCRLGGHKRHLRCCWHQTGNGNRAYYNLYPPTSAHSVIVQRFGRRWDFHRGKAKTSQFANGQMATADSVDFIPLSILALMAIRILRHRHPESAPV